VTLAYDIGLASLPLSVERIEFLLEALVGRFSGVARAADGEPGSRGISPGHGLVSKLDPKTLRKCYRDVLDNGTIMLCARVARNLGKIASTGRGPAAGSAARYILGCKAGWKDTSRLEVDPSADAMAYFSSADAGADARARILARLAAMADTRGKLSPSNCEAYNEPQSET
jgi:hypothetical protein